MTIQQSRRALNTRRPQQPTGAANGTLRSVRTCTHLALVACLITMASVVSAQHQPPTSDAAKAAATDAQPISAQPLSTDRLPSNNSVSEQNREAVGSAQTGGASGGSPGQRPTLVFDFDEDGVPDTVRREIRLESGEFLYSRFVVVSGADGSDLQAFPAPEANDMFGWLVANLGDIDGDQVPDLAVTSPRTHTDVPGDGVRGRVHIISGATSETILTIDGEWWGFAGLGLVVVDDQDGDGIVDLLVGGMERIVGVDEGPSDMHQGDNLFLPDPLVDGPVVYYHATWAVYSTGTGELLEAGDGTPPTRFLRPGEHGAMLWSSGSIAGERVWLPGASGDLNGDGVVDMSDLLRLIQTLNQSDRGDSYFLVGDLNGDGVVDMGDLTSLLSQYGRAARDVALERAARSDSESRGAQSGSGNSLSHCVDRYEYGIGVGNCSISCIDCEFDNPLPPEGGGGCPWCPPCEGCTHCEECPEPTEGCGSQCECYPCSCDANDNGVPDKDDDDDGDGIPNKEDCDSECYAGDPCGCNPTNILVDSNNDGVINQSDQEAKKEESGINVIIVNRWDTDEDGIPDYADGFGAFGSDTETGTAGNRFAPLLLRIKQSCGLESAEVTFAYNAADPAETTREIVPVPDIESSYDRFDRGVGQLRLWKKDGFQTRRLEDFIRPGEPMLAAELGEATTFYIEAVNGSSVARTITVRITKPDGNFFTDTVRVLPFDPLTGLDEDEIDGFSIIRGSGIGTSGRDIIIGTSGDDFIDAGDGDDIIVAGEGDDVIYAGTGSNVIFASRGHNSIYLGSNPPVARPQGALTSIREQPHGTTILDEEDKPDTTAQVIRAYKLLYGENDPWLSIYLNTLHGKVRAVESFGWFFNWLKDGDWDNGFFWAPPAPAVYDYIIQIKFDPQKPFLAAAEMRRQLLDLASNDSHARLTYEDHFQAQIQGTGNAQDGDVEDPITTLIDLRQRAFDNAVDATAKIANAYASSIGIVSQAADIVIALHDVSEGNYVSAVAVLPFISAPMISGAKVTLRGADGILLGTKIGDVVRGVESGLGWVARRDFPTPRFGPAIGGRRTLILGAAQQTSDPRHALLIELIAAQRAADGTVEHMTLGRSVRTGTGIDRAALGDAWNLRPDLLAVSRNGKVDLYEVLSSSQTPEELIQKLQDMRMALPPGNRNRIFLYKLDGQPISMPGEPVPPALLLP